MLTTRDLRKRLGLSQKRLARLIAQGLPHKGKGTKRTFDPHAVATWLRKRGLAQREPPAAAADQIATTIAEAARLCSVSSRVFAGWLTDPTFPGKAGTPGRQDGYFPIDAIQAWRTVRFGADGRSGQIDAETLAGRRLKLLIDNDRAQVALEKELGTIGDTAAWENFCRRVVAAAKAQLDELADRVNARLPAKLPRQVREINRKVISQSVADVLNTLAELVAGDQDDDEDVPDDDDGPADADAQS